nr:hypothetical protein [Tanacetum cinerariifolium]
KRIFRYLKGKPYLGLWYPKDLPFDLVAYSDSDYAVVATSSTKAEYVAAASGCAQVLWIQNQLLDYGDSPLLGVNTPRYDEDRLKLMELTVFLFQKDVCVEIGITAARLSSYCCQANKSDAAEGFEQIIDFLSGSYIHYALTVSPHIYISCIKQFWNSVSVKRLCDVTRLQALFDKKKIVISEAVIREILQLNDAEGMVCLLNEEIFAGLAQLGYEEPSTKLAFYKAFFSSQWKFLIHTILQSLSAKRTSKNEFSTAMASAVIYLSKDVVDDVAEDVAHVLDTCSALLCHVEHLEHDNVAQRLEIVKLKARVKKLETNDKVKSSKFRRLRKVGESRQVEFFDDMEDVFNQGRMMNEDEGIELVKDAEIAESEGRQADKQAKIYNIDLDLSLKVLSMQEDDSEVQEVVEVVTTAKLITEVVTAAASQVSAVSITIPVAAPTIVAAYTRRRNGVIIRDPEEELPLKTPAKTPKIEMDAEYARKLQEEIDRDHDGFNKDVDWDAAMDYVNQKSSSNPRYIKRYQGMRKRPQIESEARKNMMIYLKNTTGYKMDFCKGMTYAQIFPIIQARFDENIRFLFKSKEEMEAEDQETIKSINETLAQKAAKKRKLSEEAKDLRKRLEVVEDEDDDVFVKATPLA